MIEDRDRAEKLARAILADVTLYNRTKLANASDPLKDLSTEIDEGRDLFRKRVAGHLHACFETALLAWARQRASSSKTDAPVDEPRFEEPDARAARQRELDAALRQARDAELQAERRSMFIVSAALGSFVMFVVMGVAVYEEEKHVKAEKHETAHDEKYTPTNVTAATHAVAPLPPSPNAPVTIPSCTCKYGNNRTTPRIDVSFKAPSAGAIAPWLMHVVSRPLGSRHNSEESDWTLTRADASDALFPPRRTASITYGLACDIGYVVFAAGTSAEGWNDDTGVLSWRTALPSPVALPTDAGSPASLDASDYDVRCIPLTTDGGELPLTLQDGKRVSVVLSTGKLR